MKRLAQVALALALLAVIGAVAGWAAFYALVLRDLPEINTLADYKPRVITHVYAGDGSEIASFAKERRVVVPIEDVPRHVKDAFIAAEDKSFYEHEGLDYLGMVEGLRHETHYYLMGLEAEGEDHDDEVDKVRFVSAKKARRLLDSGADRRLLGDALEALEERESRRKGA